jgi:hypothetical protein
LENIWNDNQRNYGGDHESQQQGEMLFLRVVIHGIHNADQAKELYSILKCLPAQRSTCLAIVAISTPELFHHVSKHERDIVELIYTLSLSKTGTVIYSGNPPALPWFNQVFNFGASIVKVFGFNFVRTCFALCSKVYLNLPTKFPRGELFEVWDNSAKNYSAGCGSPSTIKQRLPHPKDQRLAMI